MMEKRAEQLTLAVLLCGVAALALSDFVSPLYWGLSVVAAMLRLWRGSSLALTEMQASMIGWFGFVWVGLELILGRAWIVAFTDFLLILALAVVIEAATPRNHLHRLLTGTFLILAASVLTDSFLYALPLAAFMWFTWRAAHCLYMQGFHGTVPPPPIRQDLRLMVYLMLGVSFVFIIMPRFDMQNYLKGVQPRMATSGFNDQVTLGAFARSLDATVAFRVESINTEPTAFRKAMMGRYWRGITLSQYTGRGWQRQDTPMFKEWSANMTMHVGGKKAANDVTIAVFREASDHAFIFLPDGIKAMERLPYRGMQDAHGDAYFNNPPSRRLRLIMRLGYTHHSRMTLAPPTLREAETRHSPPAIAAWVKTVLGDTPSPNQASMMALRQALLQWTYDLNAPLDDAQPITSFIQNRRGHCELFATTLALAARNIGLPARVVNGYYGGKWNETGQFIIVRQQEAHSWTEVWLDGHWQAMDATPPSRWGLSAVRFPAFDDVWESVRLSWYRYVLEFENDDRRAFFNQLIQWFRAALPRLIFWGTVLFSLWWSWQLWQQRRSVRRFEWQLRIVDRWLRQHGIKRDSWQTVRSVKQPEGINTTEWQQWLQDWERQCYQPMATPWTSWVLRRRLKALDASY